MRTTRTITEMSTVGQEVQTIVDSLTALVGAERTTPDGLQGRYDMGKIVAQVLTSVAANTGGLGPFLNAKPDSWQAYHLRQLVAGTVELEQLLAHRTAPVRLHLDVAATFLEQGHAWAFDEEWAVVKVAIKNATTPEQADQARALAGAMIDVYEADKHAYAAAYEAAVRDEVTRRGLPADVVVEVIDTGAGTGSGVGDIDAWWDELVEELHQHAEQRMPLPAVLVDAEGLGYAARAARRLSALSGAQEPAVALTATEA